jgi:high-affinity nickel-transport protein
MPDALGAAALGLLLGLRHAADADHVAAVTTIVAREPALRRAAAVGAWWGVGHSVTLLVAGGALVVFRLTVPPRLGLAFEFAVALMLVLLGAANLRGARAEARAGAAAAAAPARRGAASWRPLAIGTVHGLAGSAAVALLAAAGIRDTGRALAYLLVFGLGTVAGMTAVTALVAAPVALAGARARRAGRGLRVAAGVGSVGVGLWLADAVVREGGLFSAAAVWQPR